MIIEHAHILVTPGSGPAFEAAVQTARTTVLPQAQGFRGLILHRCLEEPDSYLCALIWDRLEDHTETFREGDLFPQWRALVGPFFREPPRVLHYETL